MDTCICAWRVIHAALHRRAPIEVAVPTLPCLEHIFSAVLSTNVEMCSRSAMCGAKRWRWAMYAVSSRFLIVKNPWGFSSVRMLVHMAVINVSRQTCHYPKGMQQNKPMPV